MKKYDILYKNGKIFTADDNIPYARAMAVKDGKIAWIGTDGDAAETHEIQASELVDLSGRLVLPGFVDSHMHAVMLADCCRKISALPPAVYSIDDLISEIRKVRSSQKTREWIQGWGYDEGKLKEHRTPNRYDLDKGCSDSPVIIKRTCSHVCSVNSKALEMAGVTSDTPDPPGGKIGRFENGLPNGILYENGRNVLNGILAEKTEEDIASDLLALDKILLSQGVTTCSEMGEFTDCNYKKIFDIALKKGVKVKIAAYYMWDSVKDKKDFTITQEDMSPSNQIRIAGIKLIGDGSVSGRTAWCDKPYLGSEAEYGMPVCSEQDFEDAIAFCKEHKCQLSIHAMGAKAISRAIDHTQRHKPWNEGKSPHVRLEHVAMPTEDSVRKASEAGIAFVTQPIFLYAEIESYLANMELERIRENYPIADWLKAGVKTAFSTDAPATAWPEPSNPFVCLKGAVTRKAWDGTDCGSRHRVDIETAVKLYTAQAAAMLGFENVGILKEGYSADFIIPDRDILSISPEDIDKAKVEETYINGKMVYKRS